MKYTVCLYGDTGNGHFECEADNPDQAVQKSLDAEADVDWQSHDVYEGCEIEAAEVFVEGTSDPVYAWTTKEERFRRSRYCLIPLLEETLVLLNSQPRFQEGKLDSYAVATQLSNFLDYLAGSATPNDKKPPIA